MNICTRGDFEAVMELTGTPRVFAFAQYKGRWVEVDCENRNGSFLYTFYGQPKNALISECIVKICVPEKPEH